MYNYFIMNREELVKYATTYSIERLESFIYSSDDTIEDVIQHYSDNMQISQSLYIDLCTLEVFLRNAIDTVFKTCFSENWLENEIKNNYLLDKKDYQILLNAYELTLKECKSSSKEITNGKIIANLTFGFWTNLCAKKYSVKIWNKMSRFKGVFVNYPNLRPEIAVISKKLYAIRKLRNRIFHYEQIFKYPEKTLNLYNIILEIISYLPQDEFKLAKKTSTFLATYNKITQNYCKKI